LLSPQELAHNAIIAAGYSLPKAPADLYMPDNPIGWIQKHFYIPETNGPILLEEYQRAVISEALRKDGQGNFIYSLILYSDLKKSAKSTIAAAVCLFLAWHHAWESVRIVANDLKQANSRTFFYIERAIRLNPELNARCKRKLYHIELPNHTTIDAIPVDPKGEAGGGDLVTCFTELWAMKNEASQQLWSETTLSPLKFGKSIRWCESYAGYEGESPILEQLYDTGVKSGTLVDVGIAGLELYRTGRMLTLWNTVPRCPWQTKEYYLQEAAVLTPEEFSRLHENKWASTTHKFIPIQWWHNCYNPNLPPPSGKSMILALDAGVKSDCFGIVGVTKEVNPRGVIVPTVRYVRKWVPPLGEKIRFTNPDDKYDRAFPEGEIRWLIANERIAVIPYDSYQLEDLVNRLGGLAFFEEFKQGGPRLVADKTLYDVIRDGNIQHGNEPDLTEHLNNADASPEEDKLRLIKRQHRQEMKIDLAVCLSMAVDRANFYNI